MKFRPSFAMTIAVAIAFAILIALGTWQLQRLGWKTQVLADAEALRIAEPSALPAETSAIELYRRYRLEGDMLAGSDRLFGLNELGRAGYGYLQVLETDGRRFVIHRGYVPNDLTATDVPPTELAGAVAIVAQARASGWRGSALFAPANTVDSESLVFVEPELIAERLGVAEIEPIFFELESPAPETRYPTPISSKLDIANNHLSYAVTWYSFAGILLVIYVLRSLRRREDEPA